MNIHNGYKTLLLSLICLTAHANDDYIQRGYIGLGYAYIDTNVDVVGVGSDSFDNGLLGGIVGYQFHRNFGVEFRGYANIDDYEFMGVSVEVENSLSLLAKGMLPVHEHFNIYGLVGYGSVKGAIADASQTESVLQFGVGMGINNGSPLELQIEWLRLFDDSFTFDGVNFEGDSININLIYHM
ncbi:outer membrane beta-barrel protein [Shewanella algidipiscicola]|uniref:Outer membrane protein beta-barrel domain-containing protein n=1 Tax=Shewanella algidipiscicola TaxID=614070 RepID=A0ABQ4NSF9_9GAMM|nr:outer membrane beta-barrel protein [Shewanella algidipiscicola]GIU02080.1 hypothetical protein TUM4630_32490 [Shewanella algidipiscicola]